ncbi:MAG: TlpA disulfide reductase family protein [Pseudomonadales bacterium]
MFIMKKYGKSNQLLLALAIFFSSQSMYADPRGVPLDGFDIANYRGSVVYLDFWASWCGPCRATFPMMNDLRAQYSEEELTIIAVNVDSNHSDALKFLEKYPARFAILYDPEGSLASQYELAGMPTSYLFDRNGTLRDTHVGFRKNDADVIKRKVAETIQANGSKE